VRRWKIEIEKEGFNTEDAEEEHRVHREEKPKSTG